jgi:hypothetical protein
MTSVLRSIFVDSTGILKTWLNTQTTTLVGPGKPLPLGAHLKQLRSPGRGAYVLLSRVGGDDNWTAESVASRVRISSSIFGWTEEATDSAANAYANTILQIKALKPVVSSVKLQNVDSMSGPLLMPDNGEGVHHLFDFDLYLIPQ